MQAYTPYLAPVMRPMAMILAPAPMHLVPVVSIQVPIQNSQFMNAPPPRHHHIAVRSSYKAHPSTSQHSVSESSVHSSKISVADEPRRITTCSGSHSKARDNGMRKPIVILVSVKDVEAPKPTASTELPMTRRRTRASLRAKVEEQLLEKRIEEDKNNKSDESKHCALDAEMVGAGPDGKTSVLARISVVDYKGNVLLDSLVKPEVEVTDYRTFVTGIKKGDLDNAPSYSEIRIRVIDLIRDKIVVGHALENDFKVLGLGHPAEMLRDTAYATTLRQKLNRPKHLMPSLKSLVSTCLPSDFCFRNGSEHSPIEDARAPLELFKKYRKEFERQISGGEWTCGPYFYEMP